MSPFEFISQVRGVLQVPSAIIPEVKPPTLFSLLMTKASGRTAYTSNIDFTYPTSCLKIASHP